MARHETTFAVPAEPSAALAYIADFANTAQWDPRVVEATRLDDGPIGVGSAFRLLAAFYGRRVELTYTIEAHEPGRRVVLAAKGRKVAGRDTVTVEPEGAGSRVRYVAEMRLTGWMRVLDRGFGVAFEGLCARAAEGLQKALGG